MLSQNIMPPCWVLPAKIQFVSPIIRLHFCVSSKKLYSSCLKRKQNSFYLINWEECKRRHSGQDLFTELSETISLILRNIWQNSQQQRSEFMFAVLHIDNASLNKLQMTKEKENFLAQLEFFHKFKLIAQFLLQSFMNTWNKFGI